MHEANVSNEPPLCEPVQEVRLALVLYGGVSLAIYIAGVVREIHRLVRATAADGPVGGRARHADAALDAGERAYRALARQLGRLPGDDDTGPLRTRFVVDAIAGTSAGGINGLFLGKALANDQRLDGLKDLWLSKGDLARLLNPDTDPASLLNSQQMYDDLLAALDDLDRDTPATPPPDGGAIDVWLTATDLAGRSEPLPVSESVRELRHRHVFQFACSPGTSGDFTHAANPLLAFAARCTSSFPVAFAPMQLNDCWAEVTARDNDLGRLKRLFHRWRPSEDPTQDRERSYGDGGYLDNKPFSYVIDHLGRTPADLPVIRRLIYVEPVPEAAAEGPRERPDAIANARAALLDLPRREGIRADLTAVQERNRLIATALAVTRGIEKDVARTPHADVPVLDTAAWRQLDLRACMERHGAGYGVYHRLKVQTVLDSLANLAARLVGFPLASSEHEGLRLIMARWHAQHYAEFTVDVPPGGATENEMLLRFDLPHRQRRLGFLLRRLGDLAHGDHERRRDILAAIGWEGPLDPQALARQAIILRRAVASVAQALREAERKVRNTPNNPAAEIIAPLAQAEAEWIALGSTRSVAERTARLDALWLAHHPTVTAFAAAVDEQLKQAFIAAANALRALGEDPSPDADAAERAVRQCVRHTLRDFDRYDVVLYPIRWGTWMGEPTPVDVVRISPLDATSLIDEQHDTQGRTKLAGTVLNNFGAFLDLRWRRNDYLWGRLDACERLLVSALPENLNLAATLISQAQDAILAEELAITDRQHLADLLAQTLIASGANPAEDDASLIRRLTTQHPGNGAAALMRSLLSGGELRRHLREHYEVDRRLPPDRTLRLAGRAAVVAGRMCRRLGQRYPLLRGPAGWLLRLGRLLSTAVELAMPGGFGAVAMRHWLVLLYFLELMLLLGGIVTATAAAVDVGSRLLILTGAVHLGLAVLGQYIAQRGRLRWWHILQWSAVLVALIVFALALLLGAARLASLLTFVPGFGGDGGA